MADMAERLPSMGSAAGKPAQGSAAFSATLSQTIFSRPQSSSQSRPQSRPQSSSQSRPQSRFQSRPQSTSQGRQQTTPQARQQTTPKDTKSSSRSSSSLSFLSLDEVSDDNMVCESCSANFTIFKRKNRCLDCYKLFCTNCMQKDPRKCCKTCHMFTGSKDRSQLMQFKVKDLRQYLAARDIPTIACREKGELVDLVVQYLTTKNGGAFMVTVNNLDDLTDSLQAPRPPRQPEMSQGGSARTTPPPTAAAQVTASIPQQRQEPHVQTQGETDLGITRNAWPEGSSTSDSDAEHSPVASFSSPEEEPSNTTTTPEQTQEAPVRHRASISDLNTIDDITDLTVRQLKEILTLNFINYKGCVERWELEERVRRLYNEKEGFKNKEQASASANTNPDAPRTALAESEEDNICRICMDSPIDCVLLECGHMVTCTKCGKQLAECPMCRQYIIRAVHVFRT